jgi:hypothetical protein
MQNIRSVTDPEKTPVYSLFMTVIVIPEAVNVFYVYFSDMEYSDSQDVVTDALPIQEREGLRFLERIP